ncbi:hypothetical protein BC826DRAFT_971406 [Russula brevipes]|nr:hypothetical protein BC826DRAFT_971406 [Russula brevipes]
MGLRLQDPIPEWLTHIALVQGGHVTTRERTIFEKLNSPTRDNPRSETVVRCRSPTAQASIVVDTQNFNVLKDINWTIRAGDRWHLQGANGTLATITEDHPGSGKTALIRPDWRHPVLRIRAHQRRRSRSRSSVRADSVSACMGGAEAEGAQAEAGEKSVEEFAQCSFVALPAGVTENHAIGVRSRWLPQLVLSDEAWARMDGGIIRAARAYLRGDRISDERTMNRLSLWSVIGHRLDINIAVLTSKEAWPRGGHLT